MKSENGVTTYLAVNTVDGLTKKRDGTPPMAKEFIGDPQVTFDMYVNGRVDFFVQQQVKIKASGSVVNDIYRVKVPKRGAISVKRYPKPVGLTDTFGPKAPPIWPSAREVPQDVLDAIESAIPSIWGQLDGPKRNSLVGALNKLKIDFDIALKPKPSSRTFMLS